MILTPCVAGGNSEINHLGQACGSGVREDQGHLGLLKGRDMASDTELVEFTLVHTSDGEEEDKGLGLRA